MTFTQKSTEKNEETWEKRTCFSENIPFYSTLFCLILAGFACQTLIGGCRPTWFAFPINIIILLFQIYWAYLCRVKWAQTTFYKWFSGKSFTIVILLCLIFFVLLMGFIPQQSTSENTILSFLGLHEIRTHWAFIVILFLLTLHLVVVVVKRFGRLKSEKLFFILLHSGFLFAVWGGFFGSADEQAYKMILNEGNSSNIAYLDKNTAIKLPFEIQLSNCKIEYYQSGEPKSYSAQIQIRKNQKITTGEIRVNHPLRYGMFDLYLQNIKITSDSQDNYCVIQLTKQPWKILIACGILMMIAGACILFLKGNSLSKKTILFPEKSQNIFFIYLIINFIT